MFLLDFIFLFAFAYLLATMLNVIPSIYERLALSLALMLWVKSLLVYCLIAAGIKPEIGFQTVLSLVVFMIGGCVYQFKFKNIRCLNETPTDIKTEKGLGVIGIATIGILFAFGLVNALFFPITEGDGVWHEIRGVRLYFEHHFELEGYHYNSYAPFLHLLYAYLLSINVEKFKILFPLFYLCLLIICHHRLLAYHKNQRTASVFTLILGATPYFWWHSILPFLNLATGFYFASAVIYWFFLVNELIKDPRGNQASKMISLALLSGIFFGVSAWVRLEFLLYGVIPFAGLIYVLEQRAELVQDQKNKILLAFTCPLLGMPFLWLMTALTFKNSYGIHIYGVLAVCVLAGICLLLFVFGALRIKSRMTPKSLVLGGAIIVLLFVILLSTKGPKSVSPGQAVILGLYRTVFFNVFYSFTLFLAGFLFVGHAKKLRDAEKYMGGFLIAYLSMHFAIYTFGEPKWGALSAYLDATFVHFGNSVNSSGTREMLAFYPIFVFFITCLPQVRESMEALVSTKTRGLVYMVAVLNLLVLLGAFVYPRGRFILSNMSLTAAEIMETPGVRDMPNAAYETYGTMNRIREATDSSATVFLPPLDGGHRSHPLQRLYPRKLFWGDVPGFEENMSKLPGDSYFVTRPDWYPEYCSNKPKIQVNNKGYWICRMDDGK